MLIKIDAFITSLFQNYLINLSQKKPIWCAQQCTYLMALTVLYGAFLGGGGWFSLLLGGLMVACFWLQTHNEMLWDITHKMSHEPFQIFLRFVIMFVWLAPTLVIVLTNSVSYNTINIALVWATVFSISYLETCEDAPPPEPKRKIALNNS